MPTMPAATAVARTTARPAVTPVTPDAELAERAAGGDDHAFVAIMRRHNRLLFRTARSILGSDAESEDALQEAYLRAWRALASFRADSKLSTWLVRIVINEALGRLRRRSATVIPLEATMDEGDAPPADSIAADEAQQPDRIAMRGEIRRLMEARIDSLPEAFRTVFMLRAVEQLSVEEVASALSLPEATVRTRFFRARGLLREALSRDVDVALGDAFAFDGARGRRRAGPAGPGAPRRALLIRRHQPPTRSQTSPPAGEWRERRNARPHPMHHRPCVLAQGRRSSSVRRRTDTHRQAPQAWNRIAGDPHEIHRHTEQRPRPGHHHRGAACPLRRAARCASQRGAAGRGRSGRGAGVGLRWQLRRLRGRARGAR
jgi:RNA polymerase sigma-70 factor (ECF subfamily)